MKVYVDIETFSTVDLRKANVFAYSSCPLFEVLMMAWSTDGEVVHVALGESDIRELVEGWLADQPVTLVAHGAAFERVCFSRLLGKPDGEYLPTDRFTDTSVLAAERGLPRSLGKLAAALGAEEKDEAGTRLINTFSRPVRGKRNRPEDHPEKWEEFVEYCRQDVVTLIDVHNRLGGWPDSGTERDVYLAAERVNDRGVRIDTDLAREAVRSAQSNAREMRAEVRRLTGVENPGSVQQLRAWAETTGLVLPDLKAETVEKTLRDADLTSEQRRVLELRQGLSLSAAKKFEAALQVTCPDGRARGMFKFFGAHTGRWSGSGIQLQNLPKASMDTIPDDVIDVETPVQDAAIETLMGGGVLGPEDLKRIIRPLLVGPFTVVDYSQIEARVLAWLAGEQWALEAFNAGEDIYVRQAERMGPKYGRSEGKVATLALGFGSGVEGLRRMGATGTDNQLLSIRDAYRASNKRITRLWYRLEDALRERGGRVGAVEFERHGRDVWMVLPSSRPIVYRDVKAGRRLTFWDSRGFRKDTYGGSITENLVQGVARDVLAAALVRLEERGYPVVAHVHDEAIVEGRHDVDEMASVMCELPGWADGLPIKAAGYRCERYVKN